jgi:ketosteroid isomerase-like protein
LELYGKNNEMKVGYLLLVITFVISCQSERKPEIEKWKAEIADAEHAFSDLAVKEGIAKAFLTFSAEDVTMLRNNKLVNGKAELKTFYEKGSPKGTLTWSPDFVDVSTSGDMGYTYGKYVYTSTDSLGNTQSSEGIFHTVWKRQRDGSWKFVWD